MLVAVSSRTVLPGVNKPTQETEELTDKLGNIDTLQFPETEEGTDES